MARVEDLTGESPKMRGNKGIWLIVILAIVLGILWWRFGNAFFGLGSNSYQAVFLTNNQVYFGRLMKRNSQYPVLRDVYYLQITQALQPRDQNAPAATNINLVKLGAEIHGPEDVMVINRNHILFFEDFKSDSQVVTSIEQFKASQK